MIKKRHPDTDHTVADSLAASPESSRTLHGPGVAAVKTTLPQRPLPRGLIFAMLSIVCIVVAVGYVAWAALRTNAVAQSAPAAPVSVVTASTEGIAALQEQPNLVFQHVARDNHYAKTALTPLDAADGPRTMTNLVCERVHFAASHGLCLMAERGLVSRLYAYTFGPDFQPHHKIPLSGIPSRARVSPDGRYGAVTVFVLGHSYADSGFSTQTTLIDLTSGAVLVDDLEQFTVIRNGERFQSPDFNFWGVTFAHDSNRFYATLASRGKTYLVEGEITTRQARVLHENVECPSLSPDNTRIAFKKRVGDSPEWRLHVLDLATLTETPLAETRTVDDQVEWLDDQHILYAVTSDIWMVPTDGSGQPRKFVSQALSPAVVH
jgi:hypothetical protein